MRTRLTDILEIEHPVMLAGMPVGAADGMLVNLADTPANRAMFGSTGTEDDSSPLPQLRIVAVTARAGRAVG